MKILKFIAKLSFIFFLAVTPVMAENTKEIGTVQTTQEDKLLDVTAYQNGSVVFRYGLDNQFVLNYGSSYQFNSIIDIYIEAMNDIESNGYDVSYRRQSGVMSIGNGRSLRFTFHHSETRGSIAEITVLYLGPHGTESFDLFFDKAGLEQLKKILEDGLSFVSNARDQVLAINDIVDKAKEVY